MLLSIMLAALLIGILAAFADVIMYEGYLKDNDYYCVDAPLTQ